MEYLRIVLQVIAAFGLLNVWLLRASKPTRYRGQGAASMREEFAAYGLPVAMMYIIGTLKIAVAAALLLGIWLPALVTPAAGLLVVLMAGAFLMHVKVEDPMERSIPAMLMLAMGIALLVF